MKAPSISFNVSLSGSTLWILFVLCLMTALVGCEVSNRGGPCGDEIKDPYCADGLFCDDNGICRPETRWSDTCGPDRVNRRILPPSDCSVDDPSAEDCPGLPFLALVGQTACLERVGLGGPCEAEDNDECHFGMYCDFRYSPPECRYEGVHASACTTDDDCDGGLVCHNVFNPPECQPPSGWGEPCADDGDCDWLLECDESRATPACRTIF